MAKHKEHKEHKEDKSIHVEQAPKIKIELNIRDYVFKPKQQDFIKIALNKDTKMCLLDGIWGSSKTFLSVYCSLMLLKEKKVSKILYIRNPCEFTKSGKMGFIKGDINEKLGPYMQPFTAKLYEFLTKPQIDYLINEGKIECLPIGYVQGYTFNATAIIVDEAVSMTKEEILMVLSRMGEHSKMFVIGDTFFQNTIGEKSGFKEIFNIFSDQDSKDNGIFTFEFKELEDVLRSSFVRFIMTKLRLLEQSKGIDWSPSSKSDKK